MKMIAFKKEHGIWTYRSGGYERKDHPWSAMLVSKVQEQLEDTRAMDPIEIISHYCRLLDETKLLVTGEVELTTIRELCKQNNIPCSL